VIFCPLPGAFLLLIFGKYFDICKNVKMIAGEQ